MIRTSLSWLGGTVLLLIFGNALAAAQGRTSGGLPARPISASINGVVRYTDGGAPVEFVTINLEANSGGLISQVRTDRSGKFRFDNLAQSQFRISIRHPGFKEIQRYVDLSTATTDYLQLQLVAEDSVTIDLPTKTIAVGVSAEAQAEYEKGRKSLLTDKNIQAGIAALETAIKLAPNYTEAHLLLGTAYLDNKQYDRAERALRRAFELNPQAAAVLFSLGDLYRRQQKYAEAEKALLDGLKLEPKSPLGHLTLGQVYFAKGEVAKAGPEVGQALQLKPDFAEAYLLAGNLFLRARKAENALPMFEQYLKLDPNGVSAPQTREMVAKIKQALAEKK